MTRGIHEECFPAVFPRFPRLPQVFVGRRLGRVISGVFVPPTFLHSLWSIGFYSHESKIGSDRRSHRNRASFCHLLCIFSKTFFPIRQPRFRPGFNPSARWVWPVGGYLAPSERTGPRVSSWTVRGRRMREDSRWSSCVRISVSALALGEIEDRKPRTGSAPDLSLPAIR